jgi:hypothetical protein
MGRKTLKPVTSNKMRVYAKGMHKASPVRDVLMEGADVLDAANDFKMRATFLLGQSLGVLDHYDEEKAEELKKEVIKFVYGDRKQENR